MSEYEKHGQTHLPRAPRPAGTVRTLLSVLRTHHGPRSPSAWPGSGFAGSRRARGGRARLCWRTAPSLRGRGLRGRTVSMHKPLLLIWPWFISACCLGFCKHDRAPIVLYPISSTWALVIKLYANYLSQTAVRANNDRLITLKDLFGKLLIRVFFFSFFLFHMTFSWWKRRRRRRKKRTVVSYRQWWWQRH